MPIVATRKHTTHFERRPSSILSYLNQSGFDQVDKGCKYSPIEIALYSVLLQNSVYDNSSYPHILFDCQIC